MKLIEYVRCFYCDSSITIDQIEINNRKVTYPISDMCTWICPACNMTNLSYIFKGE